jgi:hypothetical protein
MHQRCWRDGCEPTNEAHTLMELTSRVGVLWRKITLEMCPLVLLEKNQPAFLHAPFPLLALGLCSSPEPSKSPHREMMTEGPKSLGLCVPHTLCSCLVFPSLRPWSFSCSLPPPPERQSRHQPVAVCYGGPPSPSWHILLGHLTDSCQPNKGALSPWPPCSQPCHLHVALCLFFCVSPYTKSPGAVAGTQLLGWGGRVVVKSFSERLGWRQEPPR